VAEPTIHKIKSNLRLFVGFILAAVIALSAWDMLSGRSETLILAERQSADYARALAEHTESAFAEADSVLREVVHDIAMYKDVDTVDPLLLHHDLRRLRENSPQIGALFLVDNNGVMFTNTQEEYPPRKISVADRDYFQNYLSHPDIDFTIGQPVMSRLVNRWRFNLMRKLNRPGQSFNGMVAAAFEVDYYKRFLSKASLGPRGRIVLMRNDGVPLVVQPHVENAYSTDFKKTKMFQEMLPHKTYGTYHIASSAIDGSDRIISYNQLSRFPLVAIVSLHEDDVLKPWVHKSIIQSSFTFGLCLFIVVLTRTIFRHLDKLQVLQAELDERSSLLAASVNEQRIILNNVSVGIGFIKNRTIQWSNALHDRMFGYEPGQVKGMNTAGFYADVDECRRIGDEGYNGLVDGGMFTTEVMMKRVDGTQFPCLLTGQAIDPEKPDDGSIWVVQDISDIKRAETERLSLLEQVQHARHLENIGTLAGGIAHDFNNLLMVIQGAADLSKIKLDLQSPAQPYLARILQATQSAAELCRKMLAYSGKGLYLLEKISLKALLDSMHDQIRTSLGGANVSLTLNIPSDLPLIKADPNQLRQVIVSVVNNAVEAIGLQQGSITISGYSEVAATGRNVILEVADTGCGMDEDTLRRVFDPFFSTKFTGRGLDMSAVSGVVKALKGTIDIKSQQDVGTIVRLAIPACVDNVIPVTIDDTPKMHGSDGRSTVLVVDDDELLAEMAENLLEALGYSVITAGSGREALQIYSERGHSIELLLVDMTMQGMDGAEVLHELRMRGAMVPVLISSSFSREDASSKITEDDLTFFIQKPYTVERLKSALDEVMISTSSHLS
jgi:PAS domain S-box-containing protein